MTTDGAFIRARTVYTKGETISTGRAAELAGVRPGPSLRQSGREARLFRGAPSSAFAYKPPT